MRNYLALVLMSLLVTAPSYGDSLPDFPFIVVTGKAKSEVAPDRANVDFSVGEFDKDPRKALSVVAARTADIFRLTDSLGIPRDRIEASEVSKSIEREQGKNYQELGIAGYMVQQHFTIKLDDIKRYPTLVNALLSMKNVGGIDAHFDVAAREKISHRLVRQAAADARRRADDLVAAMGIRVKSVFAVNEDESFDSSLARFRPGGQTNGFEEVAVTAERRSAKGMIASVPKSITISKLVNVIYKITH